MLQGPLWSAGRQSKQSFLSARLASVASWDWAGYSNLLPVPLLQVLRLLPHLGSGRPPVDQRVFNGRAAGDISKQSASVEAFLTFVYLYLAPWLRLEFNSSCVFWVCFKRLFRKVSLRQSHWQKWTVSSTTRSWWLCASWIQAALAVLEMYDSCPVVFWLSEVSWKILASMMPRFTQIPW